MTTTRINRCVNCEFFPEPETDINLRPMCTRRHTHSVMRYTFNGTLHLIPPLRDKTTPPPPGPPSRTFVSRVDTRNDCYNTYVCTDKKVASDGDCATLAPTRPRRRRLSRSPRARAVARETTTRASAPFDRPIERTNERGRPVRARAVVETRDRRDATRRDGPSDSFIRVGQRERGLGRQEFIPRISCSIVVTRARTTRSRSRDAETIGVPRGAPGCVSKVHHEVPGRHGL